MKLLVIFSLLFSSSLVHSKTRIKVNPPKGWKRFSACKKQEKLWEGIELTKHKELPEFNKLGVFQVLKMMEQNLNIKGNYKSDFRPKGWIKYLHRRGSMAKVRIKSTGNHPYTGIFKGAECGLIRLSLTSKPDKSRGVAPGLALKILRDGQDSANVSALYSLSGQGKDYNFFKYPLSNIVPKGDSLGEIAIHKIFKKYSRYPEELMVDHMSAVDESGVTERNVKSPRQIFFFPNRELGFSSSKHDVRTDFAKIPVGTTIYKIYAVNDKHRGFQYSNYNIIKHMNDFLKDSTLIGEVVTTSPFIASEFGDTGILFRHELRK